MCFQRGFFCHFAMVIKKIFKITILGSWYYKASEIRKSMLIRQRADWKERKSKKLKIRETTGGCLLSLVTLFAALNILKIVPITEKREKKVLLNSIFQHSSWILSGFCFLHLFLVLLFFTPQGNTLKCNLL